MTANTNAAITSNSLSAMSISVDKLFIFDLC